MDEVVYKSKQIQAEIRNIRVMPPIKDLKKFTGTMKAVFLEDLPVARQRDVLKASIESITVDLNGKVLLKANLVGYGEIREYFV